MHQWRVVTCFHPALGWMSEVTNGDRRILIAGTDHRERALKRAELENAQAYATTNTSTRGPSSPPAGPA